MRTTTGFTLVSLILAAVPAFASGNSRGSAPLLPPLQEAGIAVDRMRLSGLDDFAGETLSVFYVSARENGVGFSGQVPKVRAVKLAPVRVSISASGTAEIPRATITRSGPEVFNYVVFVAHPAGQSSPYIRNPDSTCPIDPRVSATLGLCPLSASSSDFAYDHLWFVSLPALQNMSGAAGGQGTIALNFAHDL